LFTPGEEPPVDHSQRWSLQARSSAIFVARQLSENRNGA
jgi:hypothetical protein